MREIYHENEMMGLQYHHLFYNPQQLMNFDDNHQRLIMSQKETQKVPFDEKTHYGLANRIKPDSDQASGFSCQCAENIEDRGTY